ncbi:hypothetical protein JW948_19000 [bacterium]|nr:hypothetical protein [bacterium]
MNSRLFRITFTLLAFSSCCTLFSQSFPIELWPVRNSAWMRDLGAGWETHSLLDPYQPADSVTQRDKHETDLWVQRDLLRYGRTREKAFSDKQRLNMETWVGYTGRVWAGDRDSAAVDLNALNWYQKISFNKFWVQWHIRAATKESGFPGFTPHARDIARAGMHAGEFDRALVGYTGSHFHVQYGRDRRIWGPDLTDNVMLSGESASYEHFMGRFDYRNWSASFFTGFLETVENGGNLYQRYIAGHAVQYSNQRNFVIMAGEVTVYYGENRPFDLSYLNPVPIHIETELNNRENVPYDNGNLSNAVYFLNADWMTPPRIRVSASFLMDEFQLDQEDRNRGRPDALAGRLRLSRAVHAGSVAGIGYGIVEAAGTYTYRHGNPFTGLVSRDLPLGLPSGSDYVKTAAGAQVFLKQRIMGQVEFSHMKQGEGDIRRSPYAPFGEYIQTKFPSGTVQTVYRLDLHLTAHIRQWMEAGLLYSRQSLSGPDKDMVLNTFGFELKLYCWGMGSL